MNLNHATSTAGVNISRSTGFVLWTATVTTDAAATPCAGALVLTGNSGGIEAIGKHIGAVTAFRNSGSGPLSEDTAPDISGNSHQARPASSLRPSRVGGS